MVRTVDSHPAPLSREGRLSVLLACVSFWDVFTTFCQWL